MSGHLVSQLLSVVLGPLGLESRRPPSKASPPSRNRRLLYFQHLVELIEDVPGDIVECGVGAGKSLFMLGVLTEDERHPRRIWGFDSFRGLPAPAPEDEAERYPKLIRTGKYAHTEDDVRVRMISYGMSGTQLKERVTFVKGYFPDGFREYSGEPIALLHLDVDLYQSYKDCLEWFEPLVVPGGVIAFDEYRNPRWVGATRAVEEYFGGPPPGIQQSDFKSRWFLIKR